MADKLLLLVMYLVFGALLVGLSIPLMQDKVKPNGWYGFRVAKTMNDPDTWYAVNHHFSYRLFWSGVSLLAAASLLYLFPDLNLDAYALIVLGVFAVVFLAGLWQSIRFLNSL